MDETEELLQIKRNQSKLEQQIEQGKAQSSEIASQITDQSNVLTSKINSENKLLGKKVTETTILTITSSNTLRGNTVSKLNSVIDSLDFYLLIVMLLFIVSGVFGVYILGTYQIGAGVIFAAIWVGISLLTLGRINNQNNKIRQFPQQVNSEINNLTDELAKKNADIVLPMADFSLLDRLVSTFTNAGSEVASAALDILPITSQFLDHQNKRLSRDQFLQKFRNALARYGFPINDPILNSKLRTKLWSSENEDKMLGDSVTIMTKIYPEISESVFRLCYFEFIGDSQLEQQWKMVKLNDEYRRQLAEVLIYNKVVLEGRLEEKAIPAFSEILKRITSFTLLEANTRASEFFNKLSSLQDRRNNPAQFVWFSYYLTKRYTDRICA